jgi:hypothetical protein
MRLGLALLLAVHGLIHGLGVVKALDPSAVPQLTVPIPAVRGLLWFAAATLCLAAAAALYTAPRWWWAIALAGVAFSTVAIAGSWADAKAGTLVNMVILATAVIAAAIDGPWGLRAEYDGDVRAALARPHPPVPLTDADLAPLPPPVQRYLRVAGVVGQPRVWNMRARMRGRIRSSADTRWMPLAAEQHNVFDEPARMFYMTATMFGIPADGYHRFVDAAATMRVKAAGLVPIIDARGAEMTQAETVTLFNDMCVLAPATLIAPAIVWEPVDETRARARFTHAGRTIRAELFFNTTGELVDFRSDDRLKVSPDGRTMTAFPWSTPLTDYRDFGAARLMSRGAARWHEPDGDYTYIEFEMQSVDYNVR